jgi:hypothetical protein
MAFSPAGAGFYPALVEVRRASTILLPAGKPRFHVGKTISFLSSDDQTHDPAGTLAGGHSVS